MSDILNAALSKLQEKLSGNSLDGSVKFDITGEGALRIEGESVSIDDSDADCTLSADADVFQEILSGDLDATAAFMGGKLAVDGDMGMAMKLGSLLA